ncbi:hypothetical protein KC722_03495, partial [Candidatus Kaiserbacteria bacterium]|nr:hypothetical protein [Candidatus Kaiserbacteria bacterium]
MVNRFPFIWAILNGGLPLSNLAHTYKVLITAAGGNAALTCLRALRSQAELEVLLVAADADPYAVGFFFADEFHRIPFANELNYIEQLLTICKEFDI